MIFPLGKQAECARADAAEQALKNQGEEQETLQKAWVFMFFFLNDSGGDDEPTASAMIWGFGLSFFLCWRFRGNIMMI